MSLLAKSVVHLRDIWKVTSKLQANRLSSTMSQVKGQQQAKTSKETHEQGQQPDKTPKKPKTVAELDQEMRSAMEGLAGDGGEAGLELEDGKAVSMKRGVRENMFRYI
ncbi:hypothetical protein LTR84_011286 [Exophiala bonariae]|uniref:Uncharacterized protein n=1 Tax=Exophiala bonariae TaxID=1690606 RepID=A0AAV9MS31_9EURO|nr:hypothetical protein LTR84_011286 [Exophiala bonariae]